MILQTIPTGEGAATTLARLVGVAVFAGGLSASVAALYRWYVRERVPRGLALLFALAGVAVVLNTTPLLAAEIDATDETLEIVDALFNIVAFAGSAGAALVAIRVGDQIGTSLYAAGASGDVDADVSEIVQTVGRVTTVQLPEEVADIVGYDPVGEETKETLAGRRFLFPRRLTRDELRDRLVARLKTDYGVGHVDVEFGDDGSVAFLAVGSRAAGIGPTLPPATNAVAIRADPAHAASAGDLVQVWETDPLQRVLTGELRGVAGDVVTVAIDAADTPKLNPTERYKLVTLPVQDRPDREFASLLRSADETLATVAVEAGSELDGVTVDALDVTVAAITREDARPEPLPAKSRALRPGDVVYAIATPENLRKVENAGQGPDGGAVPAESVSDDSEPTGAPTEPADRATESPAVGQADSAPEAADSAATPEDADGEAGEREGDGPDAPAVERSSGDDDDDEALLDGDAFPDAGDLPGMDGELDAPDASAGEGTSTDEQGDEGADDDAVPFTPLDAGEEDPLSDPVLGGDADSGPGDGGDGDDDAPDDGDAATDESGDGGGATDDADDRDR